MLYIMVVSIISEIIIVVKLLQIMGILRTSRSVAASLHIIIIGAQHKFGSLF